MKESEVWVKDCDKHTVIGRCYLGVRERRVFMDPGRNEGLLRIADVEWSIQRVIGVAEEAFVS